MMKSVNFIYVYLTVFLSVFYMSSLARADDADWGCKVILCMSNPGGATQYAECVPPMTQLYKALAKGKPFPSCSGAGYSVSEPVHEPYICEKGHLRRGYMDGYSKQVYMCITDELVERPHEDCSNLGFANKNQKEGLKGNSENSKCYRYKKVLPIKNEKPNYVIVNIEGQEPQKVRY